MVWCAVYNAVDSTQERAPTLVMEGDNDTGIGDVFQIQLLLTTVREVEIEIKRKTEM